MKSWTGMPLNDYFVNKRIEELSKPRPPMPAQTLWSRIKCFFRHKAEVLHSGYQGFEHRRCARCGMERIFVTADWDGIVSAAFAAALYAKQHLKDHGYLPTMDWD